MRSVGKPFTAASLFRWVSRLSTVKVTPGLPKFSILTSESFWLEPEVLTPCSQTSHWSAISRVLSGNAGFAAERNRKILAVGYFLRKSVSIASKKYIASCFSLTNAILLPAKSLMRGVLNPLIGTGARTPRGFSTSSDTLDCLRFDMIICHLSYLFFPSAVNVAGKLFDYLFYHCSMLN